MKNNTKKQDKGISLIALIITIIVIVILAAIVVSTSINTPESANLAKFMQDMGEVQQAVTLSYLDEYTVLAAQNTGDVDKAAIYESIAKGAQSESVVYSGEPSFEDMDIGATTAWKIQGTDKIAGIDTLPNYDNKDYYITDNGIVFLDGGYSNGGKIYYNSTTNKVGETVPPNPTESLPEGWVADNLNEDTPYILDSETNIKVPIPRGYVASEVEGETTVNEGLVIKEGRDGSKTDGINEFVWIPVPVVTNMYWMNGTQMVGQLFGTDSENFDTKNEVYSISDYREPAIVDGGTCTGTGTTRDGVSSNVIKMGIEGVTTGAQLLSYLQEEFNNMIESVETYGGFYIGRYELGYDGGAVCKKGVDVLTADESSGTNYYGDAIYSSWYGLYNAASKFTTSSVTSSMIWGSQWDRVMKWMQEDDSTADYVTNSEGKGNYQGSDILKTGSSDDYAVKNIYDMAGNIYEWTLEAYGAGDRGVRGGSYEIDSWQFPVCQRGYDNPTTVYYDLGSRSILYIK